MYSHYRVCRNAVQPGRASGKPELFRHAAHHPYRPHCHPPLALHLALPSIVTVSLIASCSSSSSCTSEFILTVVAVIRVADAGRRRCTVPSTHRQPRRHRTGPLSGAHGPPAASAAATVTAAAATARGRAGGALDLSAVLILAVPIVVVAVAGIVTAAVGRIRGGETPPRYGRLGPSYRGTGRWSGPLL